MCEQGHHEGTYPSPACRQLYKHLTLEQLSMTFSPEYHDLQLDHSVQATVGLRTHSYWNHERGVRFGVRLG